MHDHSSHGQTDIEFPSATEGLPDARRPEVVELSDGDEFDLEIAPVRKQIGEATVRMLAYNGSVPGPTLKVPQDATITVHVTNRGDIDATVHWHGLRLENRYDGTHETQAPIPVGETFTYQVSVPDPGAYWYHPTSVRTTARSWASTETSSSSRARMSTGHPPTGNFS